MKKIIKSRTFIFIITAILFTGVGVYATTKYKASEILYNGSDGTSINVNDALNELYGLANKNQSIFFPFEANYVYNNYIGSTNTITFTVEVETGTIDITKYKVIGGVTRVEPWLNTQGKYIDTTSSILNCENGITNVEITVSIDAANGIAGPINYSGALYKI